MGARARGDALLIRPVRPVPRAVGSITRRAVAARGHCYGGYTCALLANEGAALWRHKSTRSALLDRREAIESPHPYS